MPSIIPFWQIPVSNYLGIKYFGQCNNFIFPKDPQFYINNPTAFPRYLPLVPLPIPDGNGVLGFLSDRSNNGSSSVDTFRQKEYICTNLLQPLKKDSLYRLSFYIGFGMRDTAAIPFNNGIFYDISASPTKVALFGLVDSTHIPFPKPQGNHGAFGCLSQINSEWISLGTCVLSGNPGTWVEGNIEFTASANLQSIGIGPACDFSDVPYTPLGNNERSYYYFLDHLQFYQASAPKPILEMTGGSFCDGPNASITLHMKSENYYAGSQLQWYKNNIPINETSGTITITKNQYGEGWYQCGVQNDTVCIRSDSFQVYWDPMIAASIGNNPDTTACIGESLLLAIDGGANATYLWNNGSNSSSISVIQSGSYSVKASNACNTVTATKNVQFKECPPTFFVPSGFTPNNDGLNDVFRARHTGTIKSFQLSVFNRWGRRIFFTRDITKGWDATYNHIIQPTGIYVWMVQYTDAKGIVQTEKGTVALIR
jgi:gliding motility-associated-like protein